jgi:ABC-type phosphate transport system permease subunit
MSDSYMGFLDLAIAGIPALVFGIWQLISVNREIARDKAKKEARSPEGAGHAVGEHRLDDR